MNKQKSPVEKRISVISFNQDEEIMRNYTSCMSAEERMANLQQLRETTQGKHESNRMQNFDSFSEQEEDNYRWLAKLSPEQHLINATALIKRIFADKLKLNPNIGTKLTFE